jgi:hypothetical protein
MRGWMYQMPLIKKCVDVIRGSETENFWSLVNYIYEVQNGKYNVFGCNVLYKICPIEDHIFSILIQDWRKRKIE